jgi:AraC-like DNA-binding protein
MIKFGAWSTLLGLSALFGSTIAVFLARADRNRVANRLLAGLIGVLVLKLAPDVLGFAGFYDAYPWLSFAPFDLTLAVGPLLWLHLCQLTTGRLPPGAWRHLVPAAVQAAYSLAVFPLPLATKNRWNDSIHERWIDPAETFLEALSLAVYIALAWRRERQYQAWLDGHLSNREEFRLVWLRNVVLALSAMLCVWAPYEFVSLVERLDYYQRFPLYVGLALLIYYLGLEGWRHAGTRYPVPRAEGVPPTDEPAATPEPAGGDPRDESVPEAASRDWTSDGQRWMRQLADTGLWRDPDLGLDSLARALGTNTRYLSRALNEGLGMSFNEAVNGLRVQEVRQRLEDASDVRDLLALALDAGFSSKTSFNRVFKAHTGQTPSAYRQARLAASAKR